MTWLNRVSFLTTLILLLLCVVALLLRLLLGFILVTSSLRVRGTSGGPAMLSLSVSRDRDSRLEGAWELVPFDFSPISYRGFKSHMAKGRRSP